MTVVTVPPDLAGHLTEVAGVRVVPWDLHSDPPHQDEIVLVVVPPTRSPWVKRLRELPALRSVLLSSAGWDHAVPLLPDGVQLANAVGVHDTATAELALALMLAAQRDLPQFVRDQVRGHWGRRDVPRSLADARVLILGYGGIGRALAARLLACEAQVTAVASRPRRGDKHVDRVHGIDELAALLPDHDVLAAALPSSDATRGLIGAEALAALPDDALVVNVGRGSVIDTDALVAQCTAGRLRAALDVTDPEPLPTDHPLWATPGVLISPHTGGDSLAYLPRAVRSVQAQVEHYVRTGSLDHVVAVGGQAS